MKTSVAANGQLIDNEASAWAAGIPETKDQAQIYINSPKNDVIKSAPAQIYKKGDHVAYKAVITNPNPGTFMRDIRIEDEIKAEGIRIIPGTLSVMADGKNITSKCQAEFDDNERSYTIQTPIALKNGIIPVFASECGKKDTNYNDLWMTDKIEISYQAVIEQDGLEGKDIKNVMKVPATRNSNKELIREDADIPSGGGVAEEMIKIKAPKLQILKQSDKKIYSVEETGSYKLHIKQGKEGVKAKNIIVTDEFEKEGMKISDIQVMYNKQDITDECKIEARDGNFVVETGKDLGDSDSIDIIYKVLFEKRIDGAIKNTAIVQSDNTEPAQDENTVVVNIACGLDTRCYRMEGKYLRWYNVDLPETMKIRKRFLTETGPVYQIAKSAMDDSYIDDIDYHGKNILVIIEGLTMYLCEKDIRKMFFIIEKSFQEVTVMVETMSPFVVNHVKEKSIEGSNAKFTWGVKNGTELQRIVPGFSVQQEVSLVEGMKKLMPIYRVIGKIQIVRNISNKIIVLEKRGRY